MKNKKQFSIFRDSDPRLDEEIWADEIIEAAKAIKNNTCVGCGKSVDKSSMEIGDREIYESSSVCPECVEEIFFPRGRKNANTKSKQAKEEKKIHKEKQKS